MSAAQSDEIAQASERAERFSSRHISARAAAGTAGDARSPIGGGVAGAREDVPATAVAPGSAREPLLGAGAASSTAAAARAVDTASGASAAPRTTDEGLVDPTRAAHPAPDVETDRGPLLRRARRSAGAKVGAEAETTSDRRAGRAAGAATDTGLAIALTSDERASEVGEKTNGGAATPPVSLPARAELAMLEPASSPEKSAAPDGSSQTTPGAATTEASGPRTSVSASVLPGSRTGLPTWAERIGELAKLEHLPARSEMRIELEPEGLGQLDVRLRMVGGELHASIVTDHEQTRGLLVRQQHLLEAALQKSDVRLFQLDVDVRGDTDRRAPDLRSQTGDGLDAPLGWSGTTDDRRDPVPLLATPIRTGRLSVRA